VKRCALAVGAETGTAHIAAAVGTPHVVVIGGGSFWPVHALFATYHVGMHAFGLLLLQLALQVFQQSLHQRYSCGCLD